MSGRFPQGPQDTKRQKDSKLSKNEADDGFWLIDSETSDPLMAGSFSFEAGDPFQPLPWRSQQPKLEKPQQKHGRFENNDSEIKPGPVEVAITYDALQSYSALNDKSKQSEGRKRSRSSSYEGTRIQQNEGVSRAGSAQSAPIYNMSVDPVDPRSATRFDDRRHDASYSYAGNINATHRHHVRRPRYLEPGVAPRGNTPRDYSCLPDVENHRNFYPPTDPGTADSYHHHHHHQQQQHRPLLEASSPIMPEPHWILHRSSEPIALPPPQYAPNTDQGYHLFYAAVTIPSDMTSNFNTASLYSAVREAVANTDSTHGSNTTTEAPYTNNGSN